MKNIGFLTVLAMVMVFTSCAEPPPQYACPEWTRKGDAAFPDSEKVFYGVGDATDIGNKSLLRKTSDTRAINEIAQQFNATSKSMVEDYMNSVSAAGGEASEQSVTQGIKTTVEKSLVGVKIVDRCMDPADGTHYSLAKYDLERMEKLIDADSRLDPKLKEYVRKNASKFFDKMDEE